MNKLLATAALLFVACGGSAPPSNSPTANMTGGEGQPTVDPTLPSWVPESCVAYHKLTIEALDCPAIEQSKRDQIQKDYGDASQAWKAEQDAAPANVEQISQACSRSGESVQSDIAGKCAAAKK